VDPRRWWLLVCAVPAIAACAVAAGDPALRTVGDLGVAATGLFASVLVWSCAPRTSRPKAWRLLSIAPLFPVAGAVAAAILGTREGAELAVLRWIPTVPGYLIAIIAILTLVDRARLRAGPRVAAEVALFLGACLVVVQLLVVGPAGRWTALALNEKLVLAAAVLATSATMAAALTLLGVIERARRPMALVLLAGTAFLTTGRGLGTSAMLSGAVGVHNGARFLICTGLLMLAAAALMDVQPAVARQNRQNRTLPDVGQLLPHLALLVAVATVGSVAMTGVRPSPGTIGGLVFCVAIAAAHRWLTAREEQRMGARLRRSEAHFRSLVQSAGDAVVILDDDLRIAWSSPALERSLGPAADELLGRPLLAVVHPDDAAALAAVLPSSGEETAPVVPDAGLLTLRLPDATGEWRYLEAGVSDLRGDDDVAAVVLHCRDMTDRHAREQALQSVAYTDPMTGLPNRPGFLRLVRESLADVAGGPTTLLMIELDGLAAARENAGREIVTTVVAEIGRRLRATVREVDTVARMGGGAFAVLTHGDDPDADRLAARCLSVVEQPFVTPVGLLELTASVGLVPLDGGLSVEDLLTRADLAAREAHTTGTGCAARYSPSLGEAAARQHRLRTALQGARARDELFLMVQPIVYLDEERITGLEAQLRWRHPEFGEIPPSEFIPLAERSGLIGEVMRWGLEAATAMTAGLPDGDLPLRVGFKVPAGYVATGTLVADVEHALRSSGLAPERLVLQVDTSTASADDERTGLDISSLRLMGVHVALDGFGSGTSALAHLTRLPIDIVRLDRTMITRIDRDPQSRALCESIIGIAKALNLDVVAEGVETPAQLAALAGFGCGFAQGFLISRPVPLAQLTEMLAAGAGSLLPGFVSRV
jgi:diguanylate cyclase (GGDEF)-like protein/PAS domain S-box-containing protein